MAVLELGRGVRSGAAHATVPRNGGGSQRGSTVSRLQSLYPYSVDAQPRGVRSSCDQSGLLFSSRVSEMMVAELSTLMMISVKSFSLTALGRIPLRHKFAALFHPEGKMERALRVPACP